MIQWKNILENTMSSRLYWEIMESYVAFDYFESIKGEQKAGAIHISSVLSVFSKKINSSFILKHEKIIQQECSCDAYKEDKECIHLYSTIQKLADMNQQEFPFIYESEHAEERKRINAIIKEEIMRKKIEKQVQESRNLIEFGKSNYQRQLGIVIQDDIYDIQAIIEKNNNSQYRLGYKVGNEKYYVIRNVDEFIERIDNEEAYRYGKMLSFIHLKASFNEFSQKQIVFLKDIIVDRTLYGSHYDNYYANAIGRYLNLDFKLLDAFFDMYYDYTLGNFTCEESEVKIHIDVEEKEDIYIYTWNQKEDYLWGKNHLYTISDTYKITRYLLDEEGYTLKFLRSISEQTLTVLKSDFNEFYKYVLSPVESYLDIMELPIVIESFDRIQLFGDIDDFGQIFVILKYLNEKGEVRRGFYEQGGSTFTHDLVENMVKKYANVIDYDKQIAYFDSEREEVYQFLNYGLKKLMQYCEVYVSDALKKIGNTQKYTISVGVHIQNDLLEIDINSQDIPKEELSEVLKAYRRKRKFYRLKDGRLLNLNSEDLESLHQFVDDYHLASTDINDTQKIPSFRMFALEDTIENNENLLFERDLQYQKVLANWHQKNEQVLLPKKFDPILRDYQKVGYRWLHQLREYGFHGILADDMGLGKTLQVIALLESLKGEGASIVICPASLIYNWEEEIHKFTSSLKTLCITGNAEERCIKLSQYQEYDILITSYDYIRRDIEVYENTKFNYIILDEAQYIKNQKTKNAIHVKKLNGSHRLALTGTPIENSLAELWSLFDFLMPNYLYNYHCFQSRFENDIVKNKSIDKQQLLKRLVTPFILRRNKQEVLKELPEKIEKNYLIDFTEEEYKIYLAHLAQVNEELKQLSNMVGTDKIVILSMLTRLRQLCCDPRLLFENIEERSSKLNACIELIQELKANGQKVLLFSSFTSLLDLVAEELNAQDISYYKLTGQTSKEDRRKLVHQFQEDTTSVFLISLKAGGTGLNLTAAQAVIHYDPWWNQSAQNQATDRVHRIGQKNTVQVFKMIMKNSIEEKIQNLQKMKKELADIFVENNEGSISKMSKEDLIELFKI